MAKWIPVTAESVLADGEHETVATDEGLDILLVKTAGELFAVENLCTHDGGDLGGGPIEGCEVVCPRHGARFCLRTGEALTAPAYDAIATHAVRVREGVVEVWDEPGDAPG